MVRPKKITNRNANVPPAARNTQDNTRGIIPGLTSGTTYGEGQDIKQQVQATGGLPQASMPQAQATVAKRSAPQIDVFGETLRPNEPVTSGLPFGAGVGPQEPIADDPDMLLRAIYSVYPDPLLLRLLRNKSV